MSSSKIERFGLTNNPKQNRRKRSKIANQIIIFMCVFIIISVISALGFLLFIREYIACLAINETIDSAWIGSLVSYWGGIIGGIFSGAFAFLGVFYTIKYYKEFDEQKEKSAIQPFLSITAGVNRVVKKGYALGRNFDKDKENKEIKVTIKNIGNGFANTLVIHTGFNFGGLSYNRIFTVGESDCLLFNVNPVDLETNISFSIQYIDAMRNEYLQEYTIINKNGSIDIQCGYPKFLEQR